MKQLIVIIGVLFLSGCFYQEVDMESYTKAEHFCSDKNGIKSLQSHWNGSVYIYCYNETYKHVNEIKFNYKTGEVIK